MGERDLRFGIPKDYVGPFSLASLLSLVLLSLVQGNLATRTRLIQFLSLVQGNLATRTRLIQSNYTPKNPKLLGQMILSSFAEEKKTKGADMSPKEKSNNS